MKDKTAIAVAAKTKKPTDDYLSLEIVEWGGRIHCVYLDSFRIAGGKPWGGGNIIKAFKVSRADIIRALPAAAQEKDNG